MRRRCAYPARRPPDRHGRADPSTARPGLVSTRRPAQSNDEGARRILLESYQPQVPLTNDRHPEDETGLPGDMSGQIR